MLGLVSAVYLFLTFIAHRNTSIPPAAIPTVVAVAVVVAVWVFAPGVLAAGRYSLPVGVRQAGLAAGAGAVISRYLVIRRRAREQPAGALDAVATPLLGVSLVLTSANWLVAVAAGIMVGTEIFRRAAASSGQGSRPLPRPPDTE